MNFERTERGFGCLNHPSYLKNELERIAQHSSMIDFDTDDGLERPGSSYLWIGKEHHLNHKEVVEFIKHLQFWLEVLSCRYGVFMGVNFLVLSVMRTGNGMKLPQIPNFGQNMSKVKRNDCHFRCTW